MGRSYKTVMMKPIDSVAIALETIPKGEVLEIVCQNSTFTVESRLNSGINKTGW